jgi:hypothetical protein
MPKGYCETNTVATMKEQRKEVRTPNIAKLRRIAKESKRLHEAKIMDKRKAKSYAMYPYCYIYRKKKTFLLWHTSAYKRDGFEVDSNNCLISGKSERELRASLGIESNRVKWSEGAVIDLDRFWSALRHLRVGRPSSTRTCKILLEGWNFIEDLSRSVGLARCTKRLRSPLLNQIYKKLFYGNNLPAITPDGKSYSPLWLRVEISAIRNDVNSILEVLSKTGSVDI